MSLSSGTPCTVCNCTTCSDCIPDIYYVAPKMPLCGNQYLHSTHACTVTFTFDPCMHCYIYTHACTVTFTHIFPLL